MNLPQTQYATTRDGVHIAYQVAGDAEIDLIEAPGTVSHLDLQYRFDNPDELYEWNRMLAFCRYIRFDKRGTGLSDRVTDVASLEERTDDIRAVMDAAGSERAAIMGISEGGSMAMLFAALYPERTRVLIVWGGQATWLRSLDTPWGETREQYQRMVDDLAEHGVTEEYIRGGGAGFGDEVSDDTIQELMRYFQAGASPASIAALERMNMEIDIRDILPSIQVPTLIVNSNHDPISPIEGARYLAERIPNARLFEYESKTHFPTTPEGNALILDEIEEFVTGTRPAPPTDRVLTTILFTDIVDSTKRAAGLGDANWKALLGQHDTVARGRIERFGGRYVNTTGDGLVAMFDGPARAVNCARDLIDAVGSLGLQIRAGVHSGEVELVGDDVRGLAVHIGARVGALAGASEVWVSSTVKDLAVGSGLVLEDAGEHELKGVPDRWHLYRVVA